MRTSELRGTALDWAVAMAEGWQHVTAQDNGGEYPWLVKEGKYQNPKHYRPSSNWALGGPIIERERLQLSPGLAHDEHRWSAVRYDYLFDDDLDCFMGGATPLIAAMRCYVASKLGDEVQIPEELSAHATPPEG